MAAKFLKWLAENSEAISTATGIFTTIFACIAALSAIAAIKAAHKIGKDQNRAYLTLEKANIAFVGKLNKPSNPKHTGAYAFHIWVKNSGATPAEWFSCSYNIFRTLDLKVIKGDKLQTDNTITGKTPKWQGLAAGDVISFPIASEEIFTFINETADIATRDNKIKIIATIKFKTMYGEIRKHEFFVSIDADYIQNYRQECVFYEINQGEGQRPEPLQMKRAPILENN